MQGARSAGHDEPAARTVGIRELKAKAGEIVREVRETGRPVDITVRGEVVARLSPSSSDESGLTAHRWTDDERAAFWQSLDALTEEISRHWPKGISAVDAVREQRREL
jgi:prevent-host-death family protein